MNLTWRSWLVGLANAIVSAIATGLAGGLAGVTLKQMLIIMSTAAIVSISKWMLQHPFPGTPLDGTTGTVKVTETKQTVVTPPPTDKANG